MTTLEDELRALRAYRDELGERHNGDVAAMLKEIAEKTDITGHEIVSFPGRPPLVIDLNAAPPHREPAG